MSPGSTCPWRMTFLRLFGSDRLMAMFEAMGVPEGEQIEHKMLSNAIEKAQMKIESNNYGIREQLLKFDEVNDEQREVSTRSAARCWTATTCATLYSR